MLRALAIFIAIVVTALIFIPPFRLWVALTFLPAGTVKGASGSTVKVTS